MKCAFCESMDAVHHDFQTAFLGFVSLCDQCWRASIGAPPYVDPDDVGGCSSGDVIPPDSVSGDS